MKQSLRWMIAPALIAMVLATQGCALFLIGAGAGAAAGTISYVGNELRATHDTTVDRAWSAANYAMKSMEYTILPGESPKDASGGTLTGRNAKGQEVKIQVLRQTDKTTEIRIRVGVFDTAANKAAAQALYDKLKPRL